MKNKAISIIATALLLFTVVALLVGTASLGRGGDKTSHVHSFRTIGTTATCTEGGIRTEVCVSCKQERSMPDEPLGHTFVDNTCTACGRFLFVSPPSISLDGDMLSITDESGLAEKFVICVDGVEKAVTQSPTPRPVHDVLSGTRRFKDWVVLTYNGTETVNFTSNGVAYTGIKFEGYLDGMPGILTDWKMYYLQGEVATLVMTLDSEWVDEAYRTVEFSESTAISMTLLAWINDNTEQVVDEPTSPTVTFDLSALNLSAGTHSITVRAKANGYADSAESNAVSYVVADLITFTSAPYGADYSATRYAEDGMTWQEWVESEYNTVDWYIGEDGRVYISDELSGYKQVEYNSSPVYGYEEIIPNGQYFFQGTHSGGGN